MTLLSYVIDRETAGTPVRDVLRRKLQLSRSLYRRVWAEDGVRVDGAVPEPFAPLAEGQVITLALPGRSAVAPEPMDLAVAYEDADVAVIDKPAGLVVHPTRGVAQGTLAAGLAHRYGNFHLINRLDRDTSGLLLVARHPLAAQRLAKAMLRREIRRTYRAIVHGIPAEASGRIEAPIARIPGQGRRGVDPSGQSAATSYRILETGRVEQAPSTVPDPTVAALVELSLETGRTHQIRVHMSHIGHPVVGDDRYGPASRAWPRLCLHAAQLAFPHPGTGEIVRLASDWPADLPTLMPGVPDEPR